MNQNRAEILRINFIVRLWFKQSCPNHNRVFILYLIFMCISKEIMSLLRRFFEIHGVFMFLFFEFIL